MQSTGKLLQLLQAADIVLHVLPTGAGAGGGDGISGLNQHGNDGLGLHVAVVRLDGVDDDGILLELPGKIRAQLNVAALYLVVNGLAQIMEQSGALGKRHVDAELGCHQARDVRDLDGVVQNVLTIGRAVFLAAQELDELGVQVVDAGLKRGAFALDLDGVVDLAAGLFDHVFDAGGMDAAVGDELFERQPRDLAADRVERGDGNGLRRVVDDEVDAGDGLKRADVAALAADDAALHFVAGQRHHADGGLAAVVGSAAADGLTDQIACNVVAVLLQVGLIGGNAHCLFVGQLLVHLVQQHFAGIFLAQTGQRFQPLHLLGTLMAKQRRAGWYYLMPGTVLITIMSFIPIINGFLTSLKTGSSANMKWASPLTYNYTRMFKDALFLRSMGNTFLYLVVEVPIMLILAILLAQLLNNHDLKFKGFFRTCVFLPCATSLVSYSLIFKSLFATDGLVNTVLCKLGILQTHYNFLGNPTSAKIIIILALIWRWTGYNMVFFLAGLQNIDYSVYEAAKIDGANGWQTFWKITVPLLMPTIVMTAIMSINGTLQLFDESVNLTAGGPANATITMSHYIYNNSMGQGVANFGYASALSFVIFMMVAILSFISMKAGDKRD